MFMFSYGLICYKYIFFSVINFYQRGEQPSFYRENGIVTSNDTFPYPHFVRGTDSILHISQPSKCWILMELFQAHYRLIWSVPNWSPIALTSRFLLISHKTNVRKSKSVGVVAAAVQWVYVTFQILWITEYHRTEIGNEPPPLAIPTHTWTGGKASRYV